ncbi:unnamed protein product [Rodentolepis nana]|uniref:DUF4604 domain-containing protein n=1 Tax=Rodentolepis nana TaxID=102285 RepID=A0A0R3TGQ6_RODNA|nr:unnamed protein product [Rodentolepis nana]
MDFLEFLDYVKEHGDEFEKLRASPPSATVVKKRSTLPTKRAASDNIQAKQKRPKSQGDGKNATLDAFVIKIQSPYSNRVSTDNEGNDSKTSIERISAASVSENVENNSSNKMDALETPTKPDNVENLKKESSTISPPKATIVGKISQPLEIDLTSDTESLH